MQKNVLLQISYSFDGKFYLCLMVLTGTNAQDSMGGGGGVGGMLPQEIFYLWDLYLRWPVRAILNSYFTFKFRLLFRSLRQFFTLVNNARSRLKTRDLDL